MDFAGEFEFEKFHGMLPVVLYERRHTLRERAHTTNNLV
jgi:hypothetical protein